MRLTIERFRDPEQRDRGQVPTALVLTVLVGILAVVTMVLLPIGQAVDLKTGSNSAADGAALAAAKQVRDDVVDEIDDRVRQATNPIDLEGILGGTVLGRAAGDRASQFAERNDAQLVSAAYDFGANRVRVRVRSRGTADTGEPALAESTAALGLRLEACRLPPEFLSPPTVTPDPPPPGTPTPTPTPDDVDVVLRCGELHVNITFRGVGPPRITPGLGALRDELDPHLVDDRF